jgi:hypothetical protein
MLGLGTICHAQTLTVFAQHELLINVDLSRDLLGAALFARTLASCQAAVILLECGLLSQAKSVLRSALEALFALAAIEVKPELAVPLARSQEANKRSLADKVLQWKSPELKASLSAQLDDATLQAMVASKARSFNTADLARDAGMMDWYFSMYTLLSFPAHAMVSDLVSHLVTNEHGVVVAFKSEPEVEGQESVWAFAIEIQIRAARAVQGIFSVSAVRVEEHAAALRTLLAAPAGLTS